MREVIDPANYYGKLRPMSFEVMVWNYADIGCVTVDVFHSGNEETMSLAIGRHDLAVTIEEMTAIRDALSLAIACRAERDRAGQLTVGDEQL